MLLTPWGELPVNDVHVHFFSRGFYATLARESTLKDVDSLGFDIPTDDAVLTGRWIGELDRHGVDRAAFIASVPGDEPGVASAVSIAPERAVGCFMLNPLQPDALARVAAASANPRLRCICLFPAMHAFSPADPRLHALYELAVDRQFAIFIHCGALSVGIRKKLGLPGRFDMRFSNPIDVHPVAVRFPHLQFVVPHFGAGYFREALMLADLCPNVWLDTSSSNRWMAYESLDLPTVFRRAVNLLGAGRLLFGSDSSFFPRGWHAATFQAQVAAMDEAGLTAEQAGQILSGNFERLYPR